jgi:biopolymer transport protein ExbD
MKKYILFLFLISFTWSGWSQYKAEIVAFDVPSKMNPSNTYQLDLTMKNAGESVLNRSNCNLKMSYVSGPDADAGEAFEVNRDLITNIDPGKNFAFKWSIESPIVPGTYKVKLAIMNGSNTMDSKDITVTIDEDFAADVSVNLPIALEPEKKYPPMSATVKNSGKTQWPEGEYELKGEVTDAPSEAEDEDEEAFEFEEKMELSNLAPGASKSIGFAEKLETPSAGGNYKIEVSIYKDGKKFDAQNGMITKNTNVKVEEPEADITKKVTTKLYPEKTYSVSFTIKNSGKVQWEEGGYSLKSTVVRKPSNDLDDDIFEQDVKFDGDEMEIGDTDDVSFDDITVPSIPGRVEVKYEIMKDGKSADIDGGEEKVSYEIVELLPELNIGRVTLEDKMISGKTYKLRIDMKNYGEVLANGDDWVIKCKTRSLKPSNYKPPRGVFDVELDGIDMKSGESKYVNGSIKAPKVSEETSIRLQFNVYYKGDKMGNTKTFEIKIKS